MTIKLLFSLFGNIQISNDPITQAHSHTKMNFMYSCPPCFHLNKQISLIHFLQTCAGLLVCCLIGAEWSESRPATFPDGTQTCWPLPSNKESELQRVWPWQYTNTCCHSLKNTNIKAAPHDCKTDGKPHPHKPAATSVYPYELWTLYRKNISF